MYKNICVYVCMYACMNVGMYGFILVFGKVMHRNKNNF